MHAYLTEIRSFHHFTGWPRSSHTCSPLHRLIHKPPLPSSQHPHRSNTPQSQFLTPQTEPYAPPRTRYLSRDNPPSAPRYPDPVALLHPLPGRWPEMSCKSQILPIRRFANSWRESQTVCNRETRRNNQVGANNRGGKRRRGGRSIPRRLGRGLESVRLRAEHRVRGNRKAVLGARKSRGARRARGIPWSSVLDSLLKRTLEAETERRMRLLYLSALMRARMRWER